MNHAYVLIAQAGSDATPGIVGGTDSRALIVGLLTGIAFGAILQRVGASSYELIVNMLRLKDLALMKFLFISVAAGSIGIFTFNEFFPGRAHIGIPPLYVAGVVVGGIIFGAGWALAGYCPGTSIIAMVEGKLDALFTVLGGFAGALALTLTWKWIEPALVEPLNYGGKSLPDVLGTRSIFAAIGFATLLILLVLFLDRGRPGARRGRHVSDESNEETGLRRAAR